MGRLSIKLLSLVVFFSLNSVAAGPVAGKLAIVKGQVFILRDGAQIIAQKGDSVLEGDSIISEAGGIARVAMIDSNLVDVYPKSKIEISKYIYKPKEDKKNVELKVDFGKIKATVNQKYDGAKNTYQVKTPSAVAGVRGTVFTAEYDPIKKVSEVVTIEGLVAVAKIMDNQKLAPPVFVKPNQAINVDPIKAKDEVRELKPEEKENRKKEDASLEPANDQRKEERKEESKEQRKEEKEIKKEEDKSARLIKQPENLPPALEQNPTERDTEKRPKEVRQPEVKQPETGVREPKQPERNADREMEKRQRQQEKELAKRQKEAEEAAKRREEELRRQQEEAQRLAEEAARRAAEEAAKRAAEEAAKRAEDAANTVTEPIIKEPEIRPPGEILPGS